MAAPVETTSRPSIRTLPLGTTCTFIGEGSANVVFAFQLPPSNGPVPDFFQNKLLRVPKDTDKAVFSYGEHQQFYDAEIRPALGDDAVPQQLVQIRPSNIAEQMNTILAHRDRSGTRRPDWRGTGVSDVGFGMLVENMTQPAPGVTVVEFKAKWLAPSPGAPPDAVRCRNCARNAQLAARSPDAVELDTFCPLNLLLCSSSDAVAGAAAVERAVGPAGPLRGVLGPMEQGHADNFAQWLMSTPLFARLASLQTENDRVGVRKLELREPATDDGDDTLERLQKAMTLRDCTCYVRVPREPGAPVVARLGDLDRKHGRAKLAYWRSVEEALLHDKFYHAQETPRQPTDCQLKTWQDILQSSR